MTELADHQREIRSLEQKNKVLAARNERLVDALRLSRDQLSELRRDLDTLTDPPSTYGTFLQAMADGKTADVYTGNRRMRLNVVSTIDARTLRPGALVRISDGAVIVEDCGFVDNGDLALVRENLPDRRRILVTDPHGEEYLLNLAGELAPKIGDTVLVDRKAGYAFEVIPKAEVENLVLEEVPDVDYGDIGGLTKQIEQIHDAVEMPFLHPELFASYDLRPPKGVLLYGPPGNGKTLIAKAVANSLARKIAISRGADESEARRATSYFLNVKGPELLNKFVGETERQIRLIFDRARDIAEDGRPVIVFFDEMDAIFRTRGSGVSSDMENTVVPQLLAELDGVEGLDNVIVIGASNREEMIDPAILRPGRLDVKIRIERPDADAARDIFAKYLTSTLPYADEDIAAHGSAEAVAAHLIEATTNRMYAAGAENEFVRLTYADGRQDVLYYRDFASGAMIANIVDRAKKLAIKDVISGTAKGIHERHLISAVTEEFAQNEDLPNTANPDEWARISGRTSGRVVDVTVLSQRGAHCPDIDSCTQPDA
ncbi:proteasome ATPase [Corynebacterium sp. TAE3-ERU12]|uniref:proteasome ATPase n=1 Tax=Corynebacterium sp. TAE3-ERU12 TaxID=2849491 RepID=UPI001C481BA9|nr:proteasome ATPase [Corynebacterium sp. TAE3-ERU12]MBV7295467.1 proteasome ATPase [Corynebacterium sp. TAE3-ERU12]